MLIKDSLNLSQENDLLLQYKNHKIIHFKPRNGFMLAFVLIMSLMFIEVSSNQYQNQSTATIRARRVKGYIRDPQIATNLSTKTTSTTTSATIAIKSKLVKETPKRRTPSDKHTRDKTLLKKLTLEKSKKTSLRKRTKDNSKKRMRADMHQYQQRERQRQQHQQTHQQSNAAETAYLVERTNGDDSDDEQQYMREKQQQLQQPIYGTWRTKAKRPQASLSANAIAHLATSAKHAITINEYNASTTAPAEATTTSQQLLTASHNNNNAAENDYHVYERLPRRSATMTPLRNELHDQLPRPPRLTSRRPSLLVRRQYMETPLNVSYGEFEQKPKPFHFPFDGPLPAEFKKAQPERAELNNIQEILQQLQLNGGAPTATRSPQLVMLPTGLHVAGSFKNFKSSGIANFFRNKRNKKQLQLSLPLQLQPVSVPKPLPLHLYNNYQSPMYGAVSQPYQRIAMDQFYAFKPRSPGEINLLAMQQQLNAKRVKNKKKKTALPPVANVGLYGFNSSNNLLLQQSNQRPDHFVPFYPPQWLLMNATQNPKLKRIPFKVNLDIFPVLPPTKTALPLRNPFLDYGGAFQHPQAPLQQQQQFNEANFLRVTAAQQHQQQQQQLPGNTQIIFPDQIPKYTQQFPVQQEPYQRPPLNPQQNTFTPIDFDCIDPPSNENASPNSNANQIMLHLNVFPKPRTTATPLPSTNPFYSNQITNNINRNTVNEPTAAIQLTRDSQNLSRQTAFANDTVQQFYPKPQRRMSRSDDNYATLVDFEHPIVAADVPELPQPAALISNKLDNSDLSPHYDHIESRNDYNTNSESNIDQMSSEARTASLFRYPVEDLIQFQVGDAL